MSAWLVVILAGVGSYLLRISMITTDRLRLPGRVADSVELVAPAAFAALAANSLTASVVTSGSVRAAVPVVLAVAAGSLVSARTGRAHAAMLAGMPTYWVTAALLGA